MQNEEKRMGFIEAFSKSWKLNPLANNTREVLRIPASKKSFDFVKNELDTLFERDMLPVNIPEFPTVRRMTSGMNSPMMVPSMHTREAVERHPKVFTQSWDPLLIGYLAAVYFHTCEIKISSWTTQAKKMRGLMPLKYEVRERNKVLERAGFENKELNYESERMIVEEGHLALKDEMKFSTRRHIAPYGLEEVQLQHDGQKLDAAGALYVSLTEYKAMDPETPSPLSVDTPGDRRSLPVESRFKVGLERDQTEAREGEMIDETLSEAGEEIELGATPNDEVVSGNFSPGTTRELLQDLSGDDWADTATPPLGSPRKNLELHPGSEPSNMGRVLLSNEAREKNVFEGNKWMFLDTLDQKGWQELLSKFNQKVERKVNMDEFKEELWDTVVGFGEPLLMTTRLDEKVRGKITRRDDPQSRA